MLLEAHRQRQAIQQGQRDSFRAAYFQVKRSLIFFKRSVDEFETYMLEGGYGRREFRIGVVRLILDPQQHHAMRRLHGQIMITANYIAVGLDRETERCLDGYSDGHCALRDEFDIVILVTADSDLAPAVQYVRLEGKGVELVTFPDTRPAISHLVAAAHTPTTARKAYFQPYLDE